MKLEAGQRALVTGASRGLGVEIALRLAQRGLDVVVCARSGDALSAVAQDLAARTGRSVTAAPADVSSRAGIEALAAQVEALGGVDILVNNAGVESTLRYNERAPEEIEDTVAVNLTGPLLLTRAVLPGMLARGRGHIVNVASVAGLLAVPFNEPYSATKFGLVGFTRELRLTARACGWPVSASSVCPGFIGGDGLFETLRREHGFSEEGLGVVPLDQVGPAVFRAIEDDVPEVFVGAESPLETVAASFLAPLAVEAGMLDAPHTQMFRAVADARSGRRT